MMSRDDRRRYRAAYREAMDVLMAEPVERQPGVTGLPPRRIMEMPDVPRWIYDAMVSAADAYRSADVEARAVVDALIAAHHEHGLDAGEEYPLHGCAGPAVVLRVVE